jgi:CxxC-x17-CxxC domain-containing protein
MQFTDRLVMCIGCSTEFVFTADEQLFFLEKGFTHDPKRCKACKAKRSAVHRKALPETRIACAACGLETTVPFLPKQGRPVLCRSCFQASK